MKVSTVVSWMIDWLMIWAVAHLVGTLSGNIWYVAGVCAIMVMYGVKQHMEGYMAYGRRMKEMLIWNTLKQ